MFRNLIIVLPYVVLLQYSFLSAFGITRFSWRFISLRDAVQIFVALASASAVLVAIRLISPRLVDWFPIARYGIVPLGVLLGDFLLALIGIAGVRAARRLIGERTSRSQTDPDHEGESNSIPHGATSRYAPFHHEPSFLSI